jgi:hypothetical protein
LVFETIYDNLGHLVLSGSRQAFHHGEDTGKLAFCFEVSSDGNMGCPFFKRTSHDSGKELFTCRKECIIEVSKRIPFA